MVNAGNEMFTFKLKAKYSEAKEIPLYKEVKRRENNSEIKVQKGLTF